MKKIELIGAETAEDKEFVYYALNEFLQYLPEQDSYDELINCSKKRIEICDQKLKKIDKKLGMVGNTDITAFGMLGAAVYNFVNFIINSDINEFFKAVVPANLALLTIFAAKEVYDHHTKDIRANKLYVDKEEVQEKRKEEVNKLKKLQFSKQYSESLEELKRSL